MKFKKYIYIYLDIFLSNWDLNVQIDRLGEGDIVNVVKV